jgi:hypothetical protein
MRTPSFLSDHLREFLRVKKIATLAELKQALGTTVNITVFRMLKELSYRSSYSHRGRYYSLDEIPQFDPQGLWSFQAVWFSRWGNLVTTLEALLNAAPQGYFARELQQLLHVEVKDALVGNFKNSGQKWERVPTPVNDHDFRSLATGIALPFGIYDPQANRGSVFVGVSHETSAFAVTSISRWWGREGRLRYPNARHLLILADTGGSNSATRGAWKDHLQQHLCDRLGLTVTVAHYPTGASKYNPIERRLFSQISKNWAAEPLTDYDKILRLIRGTTTSTGLKVRAYLDTKEYPLKVKPSAQRLRELRITRHTTLPKWNYTITPSNGK